MRKSRIEVAKCIDGEYVFPSELKAIKKAAATTGASAVLLIPATVFAETGDAFYRITNAVYTVADYAFVLVVVFAGASWMFGNQTRMMKTLMGAAGGYYLLRNAEAIRDFMKSLTPQVGGL